MGTKLMKLPNGDERLLKDWEKFKEKYKLILSGNKTIFLHELTDDNGKLSLKYKTKSVIKDEFAGKRYSYTVTVDKGTEGKLAPSMADIALKGLVGTHITLEPLKRWQDLCFMPGIETKVGYNLFKGFDVEPKKGSIDIFTQTMKKAFGEEELHTAMDWFATIYQTPSHKPIWAVVARGDKGTGKNTLEEMLGKGLLRSENYFRTPDQEALFGRFTGHLIANLLCVGQEIVWGGEHRHDSTLKDLITERSRKLEQKGVDAYTIDNHTRLYLTSNADWVVPASGKYERRYYLIDMKAGVVTKKEWKKLYDWYEKEGGKEALMYEMLHRNLSSFSYHQPPKSDALMAQLAQSLRGMERFVFNLISDGTLLSKDEFGDPKELRLDEWGVWGATKLYSIFLTRFTNAGMKYSQQRFGREFKELMEVEKTRKSDKHCYHPGSREGCAKKFFGITGVEIKPEGKKWLV